MSHLRAGGDCRVLHAVTCFWDGLRGAYNVTYLLLLLLLLLLLFIC